MSNLKRSNLIRLDKESKQGVNQGKCSSKVSRCASVYMHIILNPLCTKLSTDQNYFQIFIQNQDGTKTIQICYLGRGKSNLELKNRLNIFITST